MEDIVIKNDDESKENNVPIYRMIALRGIVVFPGQSIHVDIAREKSIASLNKAVADNEPVFFVMQKHSSMVNPAPKDIYKVGVLADIKQVIKLPNNALRIQIVGKQRMSIVTYMQIAPNFEVSLAPYGDSSEDPLMAEAVRRNLAENFEHFKKLDKSIPSDIMSGLNIRETDKFIATIGTYCYKEDSARQALLQEKKSAKQLLMISKFFARETDINFVQNKIAAEVRASIDKGQREYYLREQIKAIKAELGEGEDDADEYRKRAKERNLPEFVVSKIDKEIGKLDKMMPASPEAGVSRGYIEWLLELPWKEMGEDNLDLVEARRILDEDHYGLEKVKDRIIEFLAVHQLTKDLNAPILCFVGPPGVGKTSIVSSIARAAGKKFVTMSLGGVRDEAEIRGHRRTYIGALPGRIISAMKQAEVINPVFLLDEVDKMSSDFRGDPASALLEVLDPNQNSKFRDHYIEIPYDLSKVMFVMTANTTETIAPPLLDRMEVIELSGYSYREKAEIAKRYLLPKQIAANGLKAGQVILNDDVLDEIIAKYTRESGVRNLEREIATVVRKIAVKVVADGDKDKVYEVQKSDLDKYLGVVKYEDESRHDSEVGLATGLAWTSVGGTTLSIEAAILPNGKGDIVLTGSLGDVMKESCQAALTYIKSRSEEYAIDGEFFKSHDLHLHFPEGATPKDGPSAGITIATAILSAITGRKVDKSVAMTGEITIRGKVLAIGGLKEKSLAALRYGVKTLIIPSENHKDLVDIPNEVKSELKIVEVDHVEEVFAVALEK